MKIKENLEKLYKHIPESLRKQVVEVNEDFERIGSFELPIELPSGEVAIFQVNHYTFLESGDSYYVVSKKKNFTNPLLRIESVCNYAHLFNSRRCDCRYQLMDALQRIHNDGDGLVIFCLDQHGKAIPAGTRGHALIYALGQLQNQDLIHDAYVKNGFKEDYRNYNEVGIILKALGINKLRILSNNPHRIQSIKNSGFIVEEIRHEKVMDPWVSEELHFKKEKLKHFLKCDGFEEEFLKRYNLKAVGKEDSL